MSTRTKARHPRQPVVVGKKGVHRFKENAIVRFLLNNSAPFGLEYMATRVPAFSKEDWTQFYQLIGYSLQGAADLPRTAFDRKALEAADAESAVL